MKHWNKNQSKSTEQLWNVHIWQEQIPADQSLIYNQYIHAIHSSSKGIGSYSDFFPWAGQIAGLNC